MKSPALTSRWDDLFSISKLEKNWGIETKPVNEITLTDPKSRIIEKFNELNSLIYKTYTDSYRLSVRLEDLNEKVSQLVLDDTQELVIDEKQITAILETLDQLDDLIWAMELSRIE